jgi:hypothetical protein
VRLGAVVSGTSGRVAKARQKSILLLNGDQMIIEGKSTNFRLAGGGFDAAVTELRLAGREYAVPDVALPFLGHGLDLSLFNIAALPSGDTLSLRISYSGATPRLPGVRITRAADGTASGYLTAAGAVAFGAALARQFAADHASASYGTDGLFSGGVWISAANGAVATSAASAAAAAKAAGQTPNSPRFPMHTVTVRGLTTAGRPDTGDLVFLVNATNNAIYGDPLEDPSIFYHGSAKFSVPAGKYWALALFTMVDSKGLATGARIVLEPRITIKAAATITMSARSATSELTFATAKPTTVIASAVNLNFADPHYNVSGFSLIGGQGFPEWFSPTKQRLAAGTFGESVDAWLAAPASGPAGPDVSPDLYAGAFQNTSGLIGSQHFALPAASLATVHAVYASDVATTGGVSISAISASQLLGGISIGVYVPVEVPALVTEHLLTGPGTYWQTQYIQSENKLGGGQTDLPRALAAGSVTTEDWNVYPLNTPLNSSVGLTGPAADGLYFGQSLSATRAGKWLALDLNPFTDSTAGHTGTGYAQGIFGTIGAISGSYLIDDNGAKIASGNIPAQPGFGSFYDYLELPAAPSKVSLTLRAKRTGTLFPLSTGISDTWTWRSASTPKVTLPPGWYCADGSPTCAVQPLLTFGYQVANIAVNGTTPAGPQEVRINVGHQALLPSPPAVTKVTAQFSTDSGASWQPASVSGSGGTRYASFSAPSGSFVSLRVSATDAAGGALTETLTRAFSTQTLVVAAARRAAPLVTAGPSAGQRATGAASAYRPACAPVGPSQAQCFVMFAPESAAASVGAVAGSVPATAGTPAKKIKPPAGWGARNIEDAYKLRVGKGSKAVVAVVEAYDTPKLETYLNDYRREYGIAPCTVKNGCFEKVGQSGSAKHLPANGVQSGWDLEATLDVDMVSAACPTCRILVVEADGQAFNQLAAAEDTAVRLGAVAISNSYGGRETGLTQSFAKAYDHPGHAIVASSGDYGFTAALFPANQATVTAVGGTELSKSKGKRGWRETVWNTAGAGAGSSGCSAYVAKPSWQHDKDCSGRTVADVSALAWNVAVYNKDWGGWILVGGTSAASPIIAGIYGLAGNATTVKPGYEYAHTKALYDVVAGNNDWFFGENGAVCGHDYLCVAKRRYDAPTGLGTPDGTGAF